MARLVILRFEDDEEADRFVRSAIMMTPHQSDYIVSADYVNATVEGMVQTPTKFCDCSYRGDGWRFSDKHGWWIHFACGKPSVGWAENYKAVVGEANDLLERKSANTSGRNQRNYEPTGEHILSDSENTTA